MLKKKKNQFVCCAHSVVSNSFEPWTHQAPLSMEFSREGHYSGLPFSPPESLPDTGLETLSPTSPALAGGSFFFFFF